MPASPTPDQVLAYEKPTEGFLCPLSANTYGIEFVEFEVKDNDSGTVVFKVAKDPDAPPMQLPDDLDEEMERQIRTIRYTFPTEFLRYKIIKTSLVFSVGDKPVPNFRMIERHYHKNKIVRSYDFTFGFCIPGTTNSWEATYTVPELSDEEIKSFVSSPYETASDSFYFVGDELIMHNKAYYAYE
mmetsp:Transcript_25280/g.86577  ORF Transcript_25280/g.86577 Transcript_25280/m.86577 type:complete len:185 (-) Transcript_25280:206-760(-)